VLDRDSYVMGKEVQLFEEEWADYCKAKYCVGLSSCTDALYLALRYVFETLDIDLRDPPLVITSPATFYATTQAIVHARGFPAFMDIDETDNLPPQDFGETVALPVNLYGRPGDWKGEYVIEDAAQSHGIPLRGLAACFSFYPTKNLGAIGQAGAIVTNNLDMARAIREMRTYGERERFVYYNTTGNYRMDEIQAAILRAKLPHLTEWNQGRRYIAGIYRDLLEGLGRITLPVDHPEHVYHAYVIKCGNRDDLANYLREWGVQTSMRYPIPSHLQPALGYLGYKKGDFPFAEAWAKENLNLPMYPEMAGNQAEYVCEKIIEWAGGN